jgi:2-dehydropantoate 2-reductase
MTSYGILGTGALGGYYGAKLQQAGMEVHFLLRSDYAHVKQSGLTIVSTDGNFVLPEVNAYDSVQQMPACDVVLLALKTTQNYLLPQLLPPLIKENTVVLVLQNGLGVEEQVAAIAGNERVLGGLCFICANKVGAGHIHHLDYKAIVLGEYAPQYHAQGISRRMEQLRQDFAQADIPLELTEDLLLARWRKLVWNIPYNGLSVVLDATTAEMMASPEIVILVRKIMEEVAAAAAGYHRLISPSYLDKMLDHTSKMKPYRTSMKIDYDAHRPLEIETILLNPLKSAQAVGIKLSLIPMLYQQLKFLDARNTNTKSRKD